MIDGRFQLVVIPMRDHHQLTRSLVERLVEDGEVDRVVVVDNETRGPGGVKWLAAVDAGRYGGVEVWRWPGDGVIYDIWNAVWREAVRLWDEGAGPLVDLSVFNNDITLPPGAIGHLSRGLRSGALSGRHTQRGLTIEDVWAVYPDWRMNTLSTLVTDPPTLVPTSGTFRRNGLSGFCFMLKPELHVTHGLPLIDEQFRWYAGDGDLVQQIQLAGATCAYIDGLPLLFQTRTTSHNSRNRNWASKMGRADMKRSKAKYPTPESFEVWERRWA